MSIIGAACICLLPAAPASWADGHDALQFVQPHSRCMRAAPGRIITSVGSFSGYNGQTFEIVADTKLSPQPSGNFTEYYEPTITAFNVACSPVWMERFVYPYSEIGFRTLQVAGGPMLQIAAITSYPPGDDTFIAEDLLVADGNALKSIIPIPLWGDKDAINYVGQIRAGRDFAIVQTTFRWPWNARRTHSNRTTNAMLFRWQLFKPPYGTAFHAFASPIFLDVKELAALHLPPVSNDYFPPFPLYQFITD